MYVYFLIIYCQNIYVNMYLMTRGNSSFTVWFFPKKNATNYITVYLNEKFKREKEKKILNKYLNRDKEQKDKVYRLKVMILPVMIEFIRQYY